MYIPSLLFGGLNTCVSASGGDSTGEFISGSTIYKFHKYTTLGSGSFTIHSGSAPEAKVFIVAGGGGGGLTDFYNEALNESAGGGGAGGVVFTDYRLGPGTYNLYVGDGGDAKFEGEDSWIEMDYLPSDYQFFAPTGSRLTAEGGGTGGYFSGTTPIQATAGGSGGGGCATLRFAPGGYIISNSNGGRAPQGNGGGISVGTLCQNNTETTAVGGGGFGAKSDDTNCINPSTYQTPGGAGGNFNVDGTPTLYSVGGPSMRRGTWELASGDTENRATRPKGAGGFASSDSYSKSATLTKGKEGMVVIMYPICNADLTECTTYNVNGGELGGSITYIPCGEPSVETFNLDPLDRVTICSLPITIGANQYPQKTGTVTFTASGSCDTYIPPVNPPSCPTGSDLAEVNITELIVNAPNVGPFPGYVCFNALDFQNQIVGFCHGTGTYNKCILSGSLIATAGTSGASYSDTYTGTLCSYTCELTSSVEVTSGSVVNVVLLPQDMANYQTSSQITMDWINNGTTLEIWAQSGYETNGSLRSFINLHDNNAGGTREYMEIAYIDEHPTSGLSDIKVYSNYFNGSTNTSTARGSNINGLWNHHVLTWDKSSTSLKYYRNGSLVDTVSLGSVSSDLTDPYLNVGLNAQNANFLPGYYGEYRVYPFALNNTQVLYNYDNTKQRYQL